MLLVCLASLLVSFWLCHFDLFLYFLKVRDMAELGISESFKVKQVVLLSATEAAEMIVRVNEIVTCAPRWREDRM